MKNKLLIAILVAIPLTVFAADPDLIIPHSHTDLTFFEGNISCDTTATQLLTRKIAKVSFINNSGGSIYISDDNAVSTGDTEIKDGVPLNNILVRDMNQVWCIASGVAKTLHFVGTE